MTATSASKRYVHLDGLRGVLAIAVVIHHFAFAMQLPWFNKAWISVDAFFILSGFVIAHSYQSKISQGMGPWEFAEARISRLYPVYFAGLALGTLALLTNRDIPLPEIPDQISAVALGLLVLPSLNNLTWPAIAGVSQGGIFPLNSPAWSLFFELTVNAIFFAWLKCFQKISAWLIVGIFFLVHIAASQHYGLHSGWGEENFLAGFGRVILFFFLGVAIYKTDNIINYRSTTPFLLGALALLIGFSFRNNYIDYILLFCIAPATIYFGSNTEYRWGILEKTMTWIGGISYPLYITHYPFGLILRNTVFSEISGPSFVIASTALCVVLADAITRGEKLVRGRLLRNRLT